ncbi:MAG: hypothetical protein ACKVIT_09470 [Candidatus Puniceispirillales bacterium]|jgi:hypothetical protein|tara:strand:- start:244 stop:726 length:483 start_codon:yes stop_codon:yes gene_type:complete
MINKILIFILILGFNAQLSAETKGLKDDLSGDLSTVETITTIEKKLLVENKDTTIDEELPAVNPFLGGASTSAGQNNTNAENSQDGSLLNNLKLVGIIKGEAKNIAIFSSPDGRSIRYSEGTIVNANLMILDIFNDHIYFKINEQEYTIDLNNIITKSEG